MENKNILEGAPFVVKTFQMLQDEANKELVSWNERGDGFIVWNPVDFTNQVLNKYFKHNNFCSFIRQLNTYGFRREESKNWEFKHELFLKGKTENLPKILRRKSKKRTTEGETSDLTSTSPSTVISIAKDTFAPNGKFLTETEQEIDKIKGVNTLLMKEIIRLQEKQEETEGHVKRILAALVRSKKEQQELREKLNILHQIFIQYTTRTSSFVENVNTFTPPSNLGTPNFPFSPEKSEVETTDFNELTKEILESNLLDNLSDSLQFSELDLT